MKNKVAFAWQAGYTRIYGTHFLCSKNQCFRIIPFAVLARENQPVKGQRNVRANVGSCNKQKQNKKQKPKRITYGFWSAFNFGWAEHPQHKIREQHIFYCFGFCFNHSRYVWAQLDLNSIDAPHWNAFQTFMILFLLNCMRNKWGKLSSARLNVRNHWVIFSYLECAFVIIYCKFLSPRKNRKQFRMISRLISYHDPALCSNSKCGVGPRLKNTEKNKQNNNSRNLPIAQWSSHA